MDGKLVAFVHLVADLARVEVVVVAVREPPVFAFRTKVLDVAVRYGVGRRLAVGALAACLELELRLCRFPDVDLNSSVPATRPLNQFERLRDAARPSKRRRNRRGRSQALELGHRRFSSAVLMSASSASRRTSRSGTTLQSGISRSASSSCLEP